MLTWKTIKHNISGGRLDVYYMGKVEFARVYFDTMAERGNPNCYRISSPILNLGGHANLPKTHFASIEEAKKAVEDYAVRWMELAQVRCVDV